jgi:hypothetical protein
MVMRPTDPNFMKILVAARLEALRGGRPMPTNCHIPRSN